MQGKDKVIKDTTGPMKLARSRYFGIKIGFVEKLGTD
jgi:hypothetical protein